MPTRVLLDNLIEYNVPTGLGNFPSAETGYGGGDPFHPQVARAWLANFAASSYTWNLDLGSSQAADYCAVVDAKGLTLGPGQVTSVVFGTAATLGGAATTRGTITPNSRGDGCKAFTSVSSRYWQIVVNMASSADNLRVGLFALGVRVDLPRQWRSRSRNPGHRTILNESPTGSFAVRRATRREELDLSWPPIQESELEDLEALVDATSGAFTPFILQPRSGDESEVYHGRIEDEFSTELEPDEIIYGARYRFVESGRAL